MRSISMYQERRHLSQGELAWLMPEVREVSWSDILEAPVPTSQLDGR